MSEERDELAKREENESVEKKKRASSKKWEETEEEKAAREIVEQKVGEFREAFEENEIKKTDKDVDMLIEKLGKGKKKK